MSETRSDDNLYPLYLYIYNAEGRYGDPIIIANEAELNYASTKELLRVVKAMGRKIIMTDSLDQCVLHIENNRIVFPLPLPATEIKGAKR